MKTNLKAVVATVLLTASSAQAGGLAEPVELMEPEEVIAATVPSSSASELLIPFILLALIAIASSGSSGSGAIGGDAILSPL